MAVGGYAVQQIALFRRTSGGGLAFRSCVGARKGGFPCVPGRGIGSIVDLAFSPDGRNLYAASANADPGLVVLARDATTGKLTQLPGAAGCIQRRGRKEPERPPCATVPADGFAPKIVRVLPDGRTVLVVARSARESGIFVFRRDTRTGALAVLSCFTTKGRPPCRPGLPVDSVDLAATADGRTLFGVTETYDPQSGPGFGHIEVFGLEPGQRRSRPRRVLLDGRTRLCPDPGARRRRERGSRG